MFFLGLGETRSVIKAPDDICSQSPDGGPCRAYFPRYYYDEKEQKCKTFVYGGCLGNANRFSDKQECEQACGRSKFIRFNLIGMSTSVIGLHFQMSTSVI